MSRYYGLLKDPTRRKIIEILGAKGKSGFKDLRENLGLGVGTIYYHLDMLSDFVIQDKHRKYLLNDRGRILYKTMKEGTLPPSLEIGEAFSHRLGRWLLFSPFFVRAARAERLLPVSILVLTFGAIGSAIAKLEPILLFYFPCAYEFETIVTLFFFHWIGLFLISNLLIFVFYRRASGNLQLFTCVGISALPLALFPYIYLLTSYEVARYVLLTFQIWGLMLLSSALCFGKGLRLDRSFLVILTILYINIILLVVLGRLK